ncbi:MerR family transcriptional regulator [Agrilactobacillus yilanensis]|uniref:MerR family transcriptional regulator n=1 Tax=Agrilactobacillus yilanensis TaxID=2485997 RepID=A0ABW4JAC5_9LACO|nr:MerR family transcriptional regulator [Agrilactobacillus yilanensis]
MSESPQHFPFLKTDRLIFGISETSRMTDVSTRQLRYWEKRGYIKSLEKKDGESRKYNFKTIIAIMSIKHFLDEGYTLQAATSKVSEILHEVIALKKFMTARFEGFTEVDGLPAIDLGPLAEEPDKHAYGLFVGDKTEIVIK